MPLVARTAGAEPGPLKATGQVDAASFPGYRSDVDGLRAVAVAAVVLFHYGLGPFPGGFVGVDVFFVISGYLITAIVSGEFARDRFSLASFYERRLRRIVPALLVLLVACGTVGLFVVLPGDLRFVGDGLVNAALFTSNILFYAVANDYFAADTLTQQPFLHTWSLSVEAQFYLVYPWLLILAHRRAWPLPRLLLGLAILSLAASAWGAFAAPTATFYLLPTRAWELLGGGLLSLPAGRLALPRPRPAEPWIGLGLIVVAALAYTRATPFPGAAALLPCLGAAMVIRSPAEGSAGRMLSATPLAFIGRISYSLYLWHWPVLVFATYGHRGELAVAAKLGLLALSFGLAVLSWWAVERPFIARRALPTRRRLIVATAAAVAVVAAAGAFVEQVGRGSIPLALLPPDVAMLANGKFDLIKGDCRPGDLAAAVAPPCRFGAADRQPRLLLWGNSYARMWTPALDRDAKAHGAAGVSLLLSKCLPLLGADLPDQAGCGAFNDTALGYLRDHPELETVILGANWFAAGAQLQALAKTLDAVRALGRRVVVVLAPPQADFPVPGALAMAALRHEAPPPPIDEARARAAQKPSTDIIADLETRYGFAIIDPADWLCDGGRCAIERDGHALYFDAGHVTLYAARQASGLFDPAFGP